MDKFRVGDRLRVELPTGGNQPMIVSAMVSEQTAEGIELVFDGTLPPTAMPAGVKVRLSVGDEEGCFVFGAVLLGGLGTSALRARVVLAGKVRHVQRREAFRVRCNVPVEFVATLPPDVEAPPGPPKTTQGSICDLSTTGIRFYSPVVIGEKETLDLQLCIGPSPLVAATMVLRVERVPRGWQLGGRFVRVSREDDARLARFILETEVRNRLRYR